MQIRDINKPVSYKALNESLAKRFGVKLRLENYTLGQLQDTRNKIRTKLSQVETNESFDSVNNSESYQKNKLFLDVLNAAIAERADVEVDEKLDPVGKEDDDVNNDGKKDSTDQYLKKRRAAVAKARANESDVNELNIIDKKAGTSMDIATSQDPVVQLLIHAYTQAKEKGDQKGIKAFGAELKKRGVDLGDAPATPDKPAMDNPATNAVRPTPGGAGRLPGASESVVREGKEDEAELVMAAKDMVDRLTGWMEDTAEMQTESMLELADAIRDELGNEMSENFTSTVKPALESMYAEMENCRVALTSGVGMLTGEATPAVPMGADEPMPDMGGDIDVPDEEMEPIEGDDFGADASATGGEEEAGRARRESIERKRKMLESSRRIGALLARR